MTSFPIMIPYDHREQVIALREAGAMFAVVAIPWEMIAGHAKQAQANHSQTLQRLSERGGLDAGEALAVLDDKAISWGKKTDWAKDNCELVRRVVAWEAEHAT